MSQERAGAPRPHRRRCVWTFRIAAVVLPFALVGLVELGLRIAGASATTPDPALRVVFEEGAPMFPGWRRSLETPKPPGRYRVFALGGSTVVGRGIPKRFTTFLEEKLDRRRPDLDVEVVNAGRLAVGSHRVLRIMRETAPYEPDLLVVTFGHNKFLEPIFYDPDGWVGRFARSFRVVRALRDLVGMDDDAPPVLGPVLDALR